MTRVDLHTEIDLLDAEGFAHVVALVRALRAAPSDDRRQTVEAVAESVGGSLDVRPAKPDLRLVVEALKATVAQ